MKCRSFQNVTPAMRITEYRAGIYTDNTKSPSVVVVVVVAWICRNGSRERFHFQDGAFILYRALPI
jgi:hypothetical protein